MAAFNCRTGLSRDTKTTFRLIYSQAGSLQMLVSGRFLVEITLGQLPLESFQNIVDLQLSIDELVRLAAELSAETL